MPLRILTVNDISDFGSGSVISDFERNNLAFQSMASSRLVVAVAVGTASGQNDGTITFPVVIVAPTAPTKIGFNGTTVTLTERHPLHHAPLEVRFNFRNGASAERLITMNLQTSIDGGTNWFIGDSDEITIGRNSAGVDASIPGGLKNYISPQPSTTPILLRMQVYASGTGVIIARGTFNVEGVYRS